MQRLGGWETNVGESLAGSNYAMKLQFFARFNDTYCDELCMGLRCVRGAMYCMAFGFGLETDWNDDNAQRGHFRCDACLSEETRQAEQPEPLQFLPQFDGLLCRSRCPSLQLTGWCVAFSERLPRKMVAAGTYEVPVPWWARCQACLGKYGPGTPSNPSAKAGD